MGPVLQRNCAAVQGLYTCQDLGRTRSAAVAGLPGLQHSTAGLRRTVHAAVAGRSGPAVTSFYFFVWPE